MNTQMSREEMIALLAKMQAENESLKALATAKLKLTVGQSGTVCLYHGAKYPIALYREQWERIIPYIKAGHMERFIEANSALLATKAPKA